MAIALSNLESIKSDKLLVGFDKSDDAAVYKLNDEMALIQTLDFFTPIANDPYDFGQIAAANALSDVYAMGGEPTVAMNIVGFPSCEDMNTLGEILRGGADKVKEAGAILVGGHTVDDKEPKYGLSVSGIVHPNKVLSNCSAKENDVLVLTKPLGLGIMNTAIKAELTTKEETRQVIDIMSHLNKYAAMAFKEIEVHSVTDITGFGLLGHAMEMAKGSDLCMEIYKDQIPYIKKAKEFAAMGIIPAGMYENESYIEEDVKFEVEDEVMKDILYDPQTSGGLLISLKEEYASKLIELIKENKGLDSFVIGRVKTNLEKTIVVK